MASTTVATSNYEVVAISSNIAITLPRIIRIANSSRYWWVKTMAGPYNSSTSAQSWVDNNGNGGIGSIDCVPSGSDVY
jgi:hypothetical protein